MSAFRPTDTIGFRLTSTPAVGVIDLPGNAVRFTRLGEQHRAAVLDYCLALPAEDRAARFNPFQTADIVVRRHVDALDLARSVLIGAFDTHGEIVGLGEVSPFDAPLLEVAALFVAVNVDVRRRGIGHALVQACLRHARAAGLRRLVAVCRPGDLAWQKTCLAAGMRLTEAEGRLVATLDVFESAARGEVSA